VRHPELILDARTGPADWLSLRGWQRLLLTSLIVCLPVPILAASGLAVPLPAIVYRVAVGVAERTQEVAVAVPGFDAVVAETTETPRPGKIKLSPQELAAAHSASDFAAHEDAGGNHVVGDEPRRVAAVAVVRKERGTGSAENAARAGSVGGAAADEDLPPFAPVASEEADAAPPTTLPLAAEASDAQNPAPPPSSPAAEDRQDGPSSSEPEQPKTETPPTATAEPPPAVAATPKSGSTPATPVAEVDKPAPVSPPETPTAEVEPPSRPVVHETPPGRVDRVDPGSAPETPPGQVDKSNPGGAPETPPGQVDKPGPGSPPETPPGHVDLPDLGAPPVTPPRAPQLPARPELPGVPRPKLPGGLE
jgi:hypothetical protein